MEGPVDASPSPSREVSPARPLSVDEDRIQPCDERQAAASSEHEANAGTGEEFDEPECENEAPEAQKAVQYDSTLMSSKHALTIFVWYAVLAILTWTCTCVMVYRPLTTKTYGYDDKTLWEGFVPTTQKKYVHNENLYLALRILQSVVAVVTIPTTSAICAQGAVIFMQRNKHNAAMTLRQMIVLADKGWTDMGTLGSIVSQGWKRLGSRFLLVAVILHVLGFAISPLQQLFVHQENILTPKYGIISSLEDICDIGDHFHKDGGPFVDPDLIDLVTVLTRSALASTSINDPQSRLWQANSASCSTFDTPSEDQLSLVRTNCSQGGATLASIPTLIEPFLSQVPAGTNTGLIQQSAVRINSTASINTTIGDIDVATLCQPGKNNFYSAYSYSAYSPAAYEWIKFNLVACMPGNQMEPKWKNSRSIQQFEETLYLDISTSSDLNSPRSRRTVYRVDMSTTAGYFELPSYSRRTPGPLLKNGPLEQCIAYCDTRELGYGKRQETQNSSSVIRLESVLNKGPLLTIALALFGEASFIADRYFSPQAYMAQAYGQNTTQAVRCQETLPMVQLFDTGSGTVFDFLCADRGLSTDDVYSQIADYLTMFQYPRVILEHGFTAAAYLANEAWLMHPATGRCTDAVFYDHGIESEKPSASLVGIIVVSLLLSCFLSGLLAVALYSSLSPRWTSQLDGFAMIRIGASISDQVPLKYADKIKGVRVLDEISGTMGSETINTASLQEELRLGAPNSLSKRKRYHSFRTPSQEHLAKIGYRFAGGRYYKVNGKENTAV